MDICLEVYLLVINNSQVKIYFAKDYLHYCSLLNKVYGSRWSCTKNFENHAILNVGILLSSIKYEIEIYETLELNFSTNTM